MDRRKRKPRRAGRLAGQPVTHRNPTEVPAYLLAAARSSGGWVQEEIPGEEGGALWVTVLRGPCTGTYMLRGGRLLEYNAALRPRQEDQDPYGLYPSLGAGRIIYDENSKRKIIQAMAPVLSAAVEDSEILGTPVDAEGTKGPVLRPSILYAMIQSANASMRGVLQGLATFPRCKASIARALSRRCGQSPGPSLAFGCLSGAI